MKKIASAIVLLSTVLASVSVHASDKKMMFPIAGAMAANDAQSRLGESVKFYFGNQPTPKVIKKIATDKTSQKTNAFGKPNEKACNYVFLSAMLQLQKRATEMGANGVINIVSNYSNVENSSETEFECHVGTLMAGVALKGDFVTLSDK